jgi:photosystem II stability/assembly factor-like uncharacterized protein
MTALKKVIIKNICFLHKYFINLSKTISSVLFIFNFTWIMKKIIYLFLFLSVSWFAKGTGWFPLSSGVLVHLNEADFINNTHGFIVGGIDYYDGVLLKTVDGVNFESLNFGSNVQLNSVDFLTENIGFVAGCEGFVAKTVDGGETWTDISIPEVIQINSIRFANEQTGYVAGVGGSIYKTIDGGLNWQISLNSLIYQFNHICLSGEQTVYAAGDDGVCAKSENAGQTWNEVVTDANGNLFCVEFPSLTIGYACSTQGDIIKTIDSGLTWEILADVADGEVLRYISCLDEERVYITGNNGVIICTQNGGENWNIEESDIDDALQSIVFTTEETGFATGFFGTVLKREECSVGKDWTLTELGLSITLNDVSFIDDQNGFIAGRNDDYMGLVYKTVDGESYSSLNWNFPAALTTVAFLDSDNGFVAGSYGYLARTFNGGESWNTISTNQYEQFNEIRFLNSEIGFVCGVDGVVYRTVNGGDSWNLVFEGSTYQFNHICFVPEGRIIVSGDYGIIAISEDGGTEWNEYYINATGNFFGMSFATPEIGYACTTHGEILKTEDGGESWIINDSTCQDKVLRYVHCFSEDEVYICGNSGLIIYTCDGGVHWEQVTSGTTSALQTIVFPSDKTGYAVGFNGTIIKTTCTEVNQFVQPNNIDNSPDIVVYPNPARERITVEIQSSFSPVLGLNIYDLSGRLVISCPIDHQYGELIRKEVDLSGIARGTYILRVTVAGRSGVKKIMKY